MPSFEDPTMATLVLVYAGIVLSGLMHGFFGLGFNIVATPWLALMSDVRTAVLISLAPTIAVNVVSILRGGNWRESVGVHWPLVLWILIGTAIGSRILLAVDPAPFLLLLAAVIVLYLNLDRLKGIGFSWARRRVPLAHAGFGLVAGFMAGTVNVLVPVLIVLCLELGLAQVAMIQVFNMAFLAAKLTQMGVFWHAGALDGAMLLATVPLAGAGLAALFAGMELRRRIGDEGYRKALRLVLWAMAVLLAGRFVAEVV